MTTTEKFKNLKENNPKFKDLNLNGGKITDNFKKQIKDFIEETPEPKEKTIEEIIENSPFKEKIKSASNNIKIAILDILGDNYDDKYFRIAYDPYSRKFTYFYDDDIIDIFCEELYNDYRFFIEDIVTGDNYHIIIQGSNKIHITDYFKPENIDIKLKEHIDNIYLIYNRKQKLEKLRKNKKKNYENI